MASTSTSPLARFRPKIKPKSPLRKLSISVAKAPASPKFKSSSSDSSSLSSHGSLSTSNSASTINGKTQPSTPASLQIGDLSVSIPLLFMTGICLFVGALILRAFYTFGTSLLRLIVLIVAVGTFLVFSQFNDRHQERQQRKKAFEEAVRVATPGIGGVGNVRNSPLPSPLPSPYLESQRFSSPLTSPTSPNGGYFSGYGHAQYSSLTTPPIRSQQIYTDGRTRNLLSPHQKYATYHT